MFFRNISTILLLLSFTLLTGAPRIAQIQAQTPILATQSQNSELPTTDERYRIGPSDLLDIRVYRHPELSRDGVRVDARGLIRMPLFKDDILAGCKSEAELEKEIEQGYKKYLLDPQVSVFVKDFQSQPVAVVGSVQSPGRFIMQRKVRLLELLSLVGGPTITAANSIQVVHSEQTLKCDSGVPEPTDVNATGMSFYNLDATLRGEAASNPFVQQGDVITIPPADQVIVVGNVNKPSVIPIREPTTVSRVIALAGGFMPNTNREKIRIVRQTGGTQTSDIFVNLKEVEKHKAEDVVLKANDIVQVGEVTGASKFLKDLMRTVVPTVANLPVRVIAY